MQRLTWFLIVTLVIPYLGFTSYPVVSDRVDKVIIDAGHGGKDPGNLGTRRYKTYENNIKPVIEFYKNANLLRVINGETSISQISDEISGLIGSIKG